jgi:cob(I)alamin adenosyltransferase
MKLYTRAGDEGKTALFGGRRVYKDDARVAAYGAVDEANSALGVACAAADLPHALRARIESVMSDLFDVGAELATPTAARAKLGRRLESRIDDRRIAELEQWIDEATEQTPPLAAFILPTGTDAAARLHFARTVLRRAEREIVSLRRRRVAVRPTLIAYINRASDLLFAWARYANARAGRADVPWQKR